VTVEGREHLPPDGTPQLFVFNHASVLDAAYAALALAARPRAREGDPPENCLPSFLLAKDHFHDNPFYYRIIGMGRIAEVIGMTFVTRSGGGDIARAQAVAHIASEKLLESRMPLAIFPQGTRAAPCVGSRGERLDSAYYTVGSKSRIKADGAHLKRGAAFIVAQAAFTLARSGSRETVQLIPVALSGTGIACPRDSLRMRAGVPIRLTVGEQIAIDPALIADLAR